MNNPEKELAEYLEARIIHCSDQGRNTTEIPNNRAEEIVELLKQHSIKGHWFISEPEYITCSVCGFDVRTGFETTKEAKEALSKPHGYYFCPHCGSQLQDWKGGNADEQY